MTYLPAVRIPLPGGRIPEKPGRRWIVVALAVAIASGYAGLSAQAPGPNAMIRVRITDSALRPVPLANLIVLGRTGTWSAGADGRAPAIPLSAGKYRVVARAIGFVPDTIRVTLAAGESHAIDVRLARMAYRLRDLVAQAPSWAPSLEDYARRVRVYGGRLIDRQDIERDGYLHVIDLLGTVVGMRIDHVPPTVNLRYGQIEGGTTYIHSAGCGGKGSIFIDGREIMGSPAPLAEMGDRLDILRPSEIELIEVYRRREEIPARFRDPDACVAVILWTTAYAKSRLPQP